MTAVKFVSLLFRPCNKIFFKKVETFAIALYIAETIINQSTYLQIVLRALPL